MERFGGGLSLVLGSFFSLLLSCVCERKCREKVVWKKFECVKEINENQEIQGREEIIDENIGGGNT